MKPSSKSNNQVINIFFHGTGFGQTSQCMFLTEHFYHTIEQVKKVFNGVGVDHGMSGMLWGTGIDAQCNEAMDFIKGESNNSKVTINLCGHSRGGVAALLLAQQLQAHDFVDSINIAMLDPVPGNLILTSLIDPFKICLANKSRDLSTCDKVKNVLLLYPGRPMPLFLCHAPMQPTFHEKTNVETVLIPGVHADTEHTNQSHSIFPKYLISKFLRENGSIFSTNMEEFNDKKLLNQYDSFCNNKNESSIWSTNGFYETVKYMHTNSDDYIAYNPNAKFINEHHAKLHTQINGTPQEEKSFKLEMKPRTDLSMKIKKLYREFLKKTSFLFDNVIGEFLTKIFDKVWTKNIKPYLSKQAAQYFYPNFEYRDELRANIPENNSEKSVLEEEKDDNLSHTSYISMISEKINTLFFKPNGKNKDNKFVWPFSKFI